MPFSSLESNLKPDMEFVRTKSRMLAGISSKTVQDGKKADSSMQRCSLIGCSRSEPRLVDKPVSLSGNARFVDLDKRLAILEDSCATFLQGAQHFGAFCGNADVAVDPWNELSKVIVRFETQIQNMDIRFEKATMEIQKQLDIQSCRSQTDACATGGNTKNGTFPVWKDIESLQLHFQETPRDAQTQSGALEELQTMVEMQRQALDGFSSKMQELPKLQQELADMRRVVQLFMENPKSGTQLETPQDDTTVAADQHMRQGAEATKSTHVALTARTHIGPGPLGAVSDLSAGTTVNDKASLDVAAEYVGQVQHKGSQLSHLHCMAPTVWEMCLIIGTDLLSVSSSARVCMACILSMCLEVVFVITVVTLSGWPWSLRESRTAFLDDLRQWRYTLAHDISYVSEHTQESLVSRVCRVDELLHVYQPMSELVSMIDDFMRPAAFFPSMGPVVAAAVLIVWCLCCTEEMVRATSFMGAVLNQENGKITKIRKVNNFSPFHTASSLVDADSFQEELKAMLQKPLEFRTITPLRKTAIGAVTLFRLTLNFCMLFFGGLWLAETRDLTELLLNAIALSFVFDVDETLFDIMSPTAVHGIQKNLHPLPKHTSTLLGYEISVEHIVSSSVALIIFLYMLIVHVAASFEDLVARREILCGGQLDFAVALNKASKMILAAPTRSSEEVEALLWPNGASREAHLVETLVKSPKLCLDSNCLSMDTFREMRLGADMPVLEFMAYAFVQFNATCVDKLDEMPANILTTLQYHNSNPSATTCDGLKDSCFEREQNLLRFSCPATCGAASPYSGQILLEPELGIFKASCRESHAYISSLAAIQCTDLSREALSRLPGWSRAWQQFVQVEHVSRWEERCSKEFANLFLSHGCDALSRSDLEDMIVRCSPLGSHKTTVRDVFCMDESLIPNLAVFCPVACGCKLNSSAACTPACL